MSTWLKRTGLLLLFSAAATSAVSAQTEGAARAGLETALAPGTTAWITDSTGRERQARIAGVSDGIVTATAGEESWRVAIADITRVRVQRSDSVLNGALIGAGTAVASGLLLCSLTEPWENCRDDVGPMLGIGALGAGIGIGIDALIHGRRTIYERPAGSARLHAAPLIAPGTTGLRLSVSF